MSSARGAATGAVQKQAAHGVCLAWAVASAARTSAMALAIMGAPL